MTRTPPPSSFTGKVPTLTITAGTVLSRVHQTRFGADELNPKPSDIRFGGGRFDSTNLDPYPFLYAGDTDHGAVSETLLRDLDADDRARRFVPKPSWRGRQLSRLVTTTSLTLISLRSGIELGAIGQDTWLTTCSADDYPQTRAWAQWLRHQVPDAAGIAWRSKREPDATSFVLFADRCPPNPLAAAPSPLDPNQCEFDTDDGFKWLKEQLNLYNVTIRR